MMIYSSKNTNSCACGIAEYLDNTEGGRKGIVMHGRHRYTEEKVEESTACDAECL